MRHFRFPLERVLRLEARKEKQARLSLAATLARLGGIHRALRDFEAALEGAERELLEASPSRPIVRVYVESLRIRKRVLELEARKAEAEATEARERWREAHRRKESLSRLEEIRRREWMDEESKREQAELEELAALGARNGRRRRR